MRRILSLLCLLSALGPTLPGCGGSPDAAPAQLSDAEKQKKMEEAKAAMEQGMKRAEETKGSPPAGAR
jgi:hypothetical protein